MGNQFVWYRFKQQPIAGMVNEKYQNWAKILHTMCATKKK